jgi:hypothetical protein
MDLGNGLYLRIAGDGRDLYDSQDMAKAHLGRYLNTVAL